ncbi:MAG: hypothetical protein AB7I27_16165 [Bacteriovoracaceae bacterium]
MLSSKKKWFIITGLTIGLMTLFLLFNNFVNSNATLIFIVDPSISNSDHNNLTIPKAKNLSSAIYKIQMAQKLDVTNSPAKFEQNGTATRTKNGSIVNYTVMKLTNISGIQINIAPGRYTITHSLALNSTQVSIDANGLRWPLIINGDINNKTAYVFDGENRWKSFMYITPDTNSKPLTIQGITIKNFTEGISIDGINAYNPATNEGFKKLTSNPNSEFTVKIYRNAFLHNGNHGIFGANCSEQTKYAPPGMAVLRLSYVSDAIIQENYFDDNFNCANGIGKFPSVISSIGGDTPLRNYTPEQWQMVSENINTYLTKEIQKEHILHNVYLANYSHRNKVIGNTFSNNRGDVIRLRNFCNNNEFEANNFLQNKITGAGAITSWHDKRNALALQSPPADMECSSFNNQLKNNAFNGNIGLSLVSFMAPSVNADDCSKLDIPEGGISQSEAATHKTPSGTRCCNKYSSFFGLNPANANFNDKINAFNLITSNNENELNRRIFKKIQRINEGNHRLELISEEDSEISENFMLKEESYTIDSVASKLNSLKSTFSGNGCIRVTNQPITTSTYNTVTYASNDINNPNCQLDFSIPTEPYSQNFFYIRPNYTTVIENDLRLAVNFPFRPKLDVAYKIQDGQISAKLIQARGCIEMVSFCPRRGFDSLVHRLKLSEVDSANSLHTDKDKCLNEAPKNIDNCKVDNLAISRKSIHYFFGKDSSNNDVVYKRLCRSSTDCEAAQRLPSTFQGILTWQSDGTIVEN